MPISGVSLMAMSTTAKTASVGHIMTKKTMCLLACATKGMMMNKLFWILFVITFLVSQSAFYPLALIGIALMFFVVPKTTPEKMGEKKN